MSVTLGEVTRTYGFEVLDHLETEVGVPVNSGLQAQGDLFIIPVSEVTADTGEDVPAKGIAVIQAVGSGHEHRLFASVPGTATFAPASAGGQDIGTLVTTEPAYLLHAEHGATAVAPGSYTLRRQREQAEEERIVAD